MNKNRIVKITGILLLGIMLTSACTQTYSQTPLGTPTLLPTGLFVSPFPSGQDPLKIIADLGTQTAMAQTSEASGTTVSVNGTPGTVVVGTPAATLGTPATASSAQPTLIAVTVIPGGSTFTPTGGTGSTSVAVTLAPGSVPTSYTLNQGEWPYCIARRFNVNPNELMSLNGLSESESTMLMPGRQLSIPRTGNPFPTDRAWHPHTSTYTVQSSGTTVSGVACYFGDILPQSIATANNISISSALNVGQVLTIP
jgi:LysM repeat protein